MTEDLVADLKHARATLQAFRRAIGGVNTQLTTLIGQIGRDTAPLTMARREAALYKARWESTVIEARRQHAIADGLRADLEIAEQHIARGNTETHKAYGLLRTALRGKKEQ